jgi:hypothetical protein
LDFTHINSQATIEHLNGIKVPFIGLSLLPLAAILIFMGAAGKSAMFPLHIWLPDAMEGPTPTHNDSCGDMLLPCKTCRTIFSCFCIAKEADAEVLTIGTFTTHFAHLLLPN